MLLQFFVIMVLFSQLEKESWSAPGTDSKLVTPTTHKDKKLQVTFWGINYFVTVARKNRHLSFSSYFIRRDGIADFFHIFTTKLYS